MPSPRDGRSLLLPGVDSEADVRPRLLPALLMFARRKPLGVIGSAILLGLVVMATGGPALAPFDPYEVHIPYKYAGPRTIYEETGQRFWLGADQLGRDTLSRLIYGARVSLYVSLVSVGWASPSELSSGSSAHFSGGWSTSSCNAPWIA